MTCLFRSSLVIFIHLTSQFTEGYRLSSHCPCILNSASYYSICCLIRHIFHVLKTNQNTQKILFNSKHTFSLSVVLSSLWYYKQFVQGASLMLLKPIRFYWTSIFNSTYLVGYIKHFLITELQITFLNPFLTVSLKCFTTINKHFNTLQNVKKWATCGVITIKQKGRDERDPY